jgi:type 1 glutamine amidotransferase
MKTKYTGSLVVIGITALTFAVLTAQNAPTPQPVAVAPTMTWLTPPQQAAVVAMNSSLTALTQARTTAQADLAAATYTLTGSAADRQAKAAALGAAEQALALARATAIAQIQAGPSRLSVAQIQDVARAAGALPAKKRLLIWADTRNGVSQHDFTSHAMAVIERMGYESGLWDTYIRTDSEIISYQPQKTAGPDGKAQGGASGGPSLNNVDAIFSLAHREAPLNDSQKADLLKFVRDDGKGFITGHTGLTAMTQWPEFREMIGGDYGGHNIGYPHTLVVEDPSWPGASAFPARVEMSEEWYHLLNYSREKIRVILRLDLSRYEGNANPELVAGGGDFPVAWARQYGKGRVFGSTFAHATESWDNPMIQGLYFEAIKWALKLQDADVTPRPVPAGVTLGKKQ